MSSWRDALQSASFRGVPFYVENEGTPVGRRTQVHEYPQRDKPFVEDLGSRTRTIRLTAFVVGDDCFERRDKLLQALDQEGQGVLVHPWFGKLDVTLAGECQVSHERREGGVVRFDLTFVEGGEKGYPAGVPNTGRQLDDASDSLLDSLLSEYRSAMASVNAARLHASALQNGLAGVQQAIQQEFGQLTGVIGSVVTLADMLTHAPNSLGALLGAQLSSSREDFSSFAGSQRAMTAKADAARGLLPGTSTPPMTTDTGKTLKAAHELVRDALLVDIVRAAAAMPVVLAPTPMPGVPTVEQQAASPIQRPEVPVYDDVIALRTAISSVLWDSAMTAPHAHFEQLEQVRKLLERHLTAVAASGVRLVYVTPKQSLPAVVLAYQRFADATRDAEIISRNRIAHPGFLPPIPLQVAQE
ncbi:MULTISPECIES: DNA circularization N-terminal domain-containing protein [unclassified Pseudomonas]|uniref:DNA circularization protein n=1 Tax=unclassified Pseudomonas TaxID=196821 RepID=UPI00128B0493|nr:MULTISPECIES: DNA circularization N-terminal domain-containing protein [unclassified Pseudomonas]MPQ67810.1 hydroxyacid dehydrogenase [Pseudomonas sp. MWU12-2323]